MSSEAKGDKHLTLHGETFTKEKVPTKNSFNYRQKRVFKPSKKNRPKYIISLMSGSALHYSYVQTNLKRDALGVLD